MGSGSVLGLLSSVIGAYVPGKSKRCEVLIPSASQITNRLVPQSHSHPLPHPPSGIMAKKIVAEGNSAGRGPVALLIPWTVMELVMRLSREGGLPEFRELDLRLMRQTVSYIMQAMKVGKGEVEWGRTRCCGLMPSSSLCRSPPQASTLSSLTSHIQHLLLHVVEGHHAAREEVG